ncbi:MAG: sulfotransferase family protein, partial [Solirubrobacteraceae bacterium]
MKVIGAGLPRTGTLSQKVALEMLGFGPCYHMVNILTDLPLSTQWEQAMDGEADWDELFGEHESTVDWPGSYFYRELADAYPDAKVVLSTRDPEAWEKSMLDTIWDVIYGESTMAHISKARMRVDPDWHGYIELMARMWAAQGIFTG